MNRPLDSMLQRRRRQTFEDFSFGFITGLAVCVVLAVIARSCF